MSDRTKRLIADAMKRMMARKPIVKIFVTDICKEAEIERQTFYYHFKDKHDVVAWIYFQQAANVDVISEESAARSMAEMKKEFIFYKRAYEDTSQNALWQYMADYYIKRYSSEAKRILNTKELDPDLQYSIRLYCTGAVGMAREWLLKDDKTPAETIARLNFLSMPEQLRQLYFHPAQDHPADETD